MEESKKKESKKEKAIDVDQSKFSFTIDVKAKKGKQGNLLPLTLTEKKEIESELYKQLQRKIVIFVKDREKLIRKGIEIKIENVMAVIDGKAEKITDELIELRKKKAQISKSIEDDDRKLKKARNSYDKLLVQKRSKRAKTLLLSCQAEMRMLTGTLRVNRSYLNIIVIQINEKEEELQKYKGMSLVKLKLKERQRINSKNEGDLVFDGIDDRTWSFSISKKPNGKYSCTGSVYRNKAHMEVCYYETVVTKQYDLGHKATYSEKEAMVEDFMAYCEREGIETVEDSIVVKLKSKNKLHYSVSAKQPHKVVFSYNKDIEIWELYKINSEDNMYPLEYAGTFSIPGSVRREYVENNRDADIFIRETVKENFKAMIKGYRMHPERYIFKQALVLE